jgi:hypothetical protein
MKLRAAASTKRRALGQSAKAPPGAGEEGSVNLSQEFGSQSFMSSAALLPPSSRGGGVAADEAAATVRSNKVLLASLDRHPLSQDSWYASNLCNDYGGLGGEGRWSRWNAFAEDMSQTLPKQSPAKIRTGRSMPAFENQILRAASRSQTSAAALLPVLQHPPSSSASSPPRSPFASMLITPGDAPLSPSPFASSLLNASHRQPELLPSGALLYDALQNDSVTIMEDDGTSLEAPEGPGSIGQGLDTQSSAQLGTAVAVATMAAHVDGAEVEALSAASRHMRQYDRRSFVGLVKFHSPK